MPYSDLIVFVQHNAEVPVASGGGTVSGFGGIDRERRIKAFQCINNQLLNAANIKIKF